MIISNSRYEPEIEIIQENRQEINNGNHTSGEYGNDYLTIGCNLMTFFCTIWSLRLLNWICIRDIIMTKK